MITTAPTHRVTTHPTSRFVAVQTCGYVRVILATRYGLFHHGDERGAPLALLLQSWHEDPPLELSHGSSSRVARGNWDTLYRSMYAVSHGRSSRAGTRILLSNCRMDPHLASHVAAMREKWMCYHPASSIVSFTTFTTNKLIVALHKPRKWRGVAQDDL